MFWNWLYFFYKENCLGREVGCSKCYRNGYFEKLCIINWNIWIKILLIDVLDDEDNEFIVYDDKEVCCIYLKIKGVLMDIILDFWLICSF